MNPDTTIPWFGARKIAAELQDEVRLLKARLTEAQQKLDTLGVLSAVELQAVSANLEQEIVAQRSVLAKEKAETASILDIANAHLEEIKHGIVATEDNALLQEAGVYRYRHPLTDVVAYEKQLATLNDDIKDMVRKDGGAVLGTTSWTVNNSAAAGRAMVRDVSKLMLRAFNAEADNLVRGLKAPAERVLKDIRRATRKHYSAEDKIRIVLDGLRGEDSIAELCRREGIAQSMYYVWSKEFLEAGKRRLAGDTARAATTDEVKGLRRESTALKEVVADQALEIRLLKKSILADGEDAE